jgi:hypothetical protein
MATLARFSMWTAVLMPHLAYWLAALIVKLLMPRAVTFLATQGLVVSFISFWYPLGCTILVLHYGTSLGIDPAAVVKPQPQRTRSLLSPPLIACGPSPGTDVDSATVSNKQRLKATAVTFADQLEAWVCYWMVYFTIQFSKRIASIVGVRWLFAQNWMFSHPRALPAALEVELFFYLYVFCLPYISYQPGDRQDTPDGRPAHAIAARVVGPVVLRVEMWASIISPAWWDARVMPRVHDVKSCLRMVRLSSIGDWFVELMQNHVRPLVLPALLLLFPSNLGRSLAICYVQFILPLASSHATVLQKSARGYKFMEKGIQLLEYWVLHAVVDGILEWFKNSILRAPLLAPIMSYGQFFLGWIILPAIAAFWWILLCNSSAIFTRFFYRELLFLGLLPSHGNQRQQPGAGAATSNGARPDSNVVRGLSWAVSRLPRASEPVEPSAAVPLENEVAPTAVPLEGEVAPTAANPY